MKLLEIQAQTISIPLKQPFKTALRTVDCIENICVRISTDTEHIGYGGAGTHGGHHRGNRPIDPGRPETHP